MVPNVAKNSDPSSQVPRILHVTEAMTAGVHRVLTVLASEQAAAGAEVIVAYLRRPETPTPESLRQGFDYRVELLEIPGGRRARALIGLARTVARIVRDDPSIIVHAHSSWAGFAVRSLTHYRPIGRLFYSPHGYAFQRRDVAPRTRNAFLIIERGLAGRGWTVAVGPSEAQLARHRVGAERVATLTNRIDTSEFRSLAQARETTRARPLILGVGRPAPQKAPERFVACAEALGAHADFVWLGASETGRNPFAGSRVRVLRWTDRASLLAALGASDIFLLTSLWEGLPLALIEAQAAGLPAVVTAIPGNVDVVQHAVTGYVAENDLELLDGLALLIGDPLLRQQMGEAASSRACREYAISELGEESLRLYDFARLNNDGH